MKRQTNNTGTKHKKVSSDCLKRDINNFKNKQLKRELLRWKIRSAIKSSLIVIFILILTENSFAAPPKFKAVISDIKIASEGGSHNVLYFQIKIRHTNPAVSGQFKYALGQYFFNFNPDIAAGGMLTYSIVSGSTTLTNPLQIPRSPRISGNKLMLAVNQSVPEISASIINTSVFTTICKMKLKTSAHSFAKVPLNLKWNLTDLLRTKIFAYYDGIVDSVTNQGTFTVEKAPDYFPESDEASLLNNPEQHEESFSEKSGRKEAEKLSDSENTKKDIHKTEISLGNNFPNPFNPVTQISFTIPVSDIVKLDVYDITGRLVKNLIDKRMEAGVHNVEFNGAALSSGVYFYKLVTESYVQTKRMILTK